MNEKLYGFLQTDCHLGIKKQRSKRKKTNLKNFCIKEREKITKQVKNKKNTEKLTVETLTMKINSFSERFFCFSKYKQYFVLIIFVVLFLFITPLVKKLLKL